MAAPLPLVTFALCAGVLVMAIVAGGSSQHAMISTTAVQLASLPLLGFGLWLAASRGFAGLAWPAAILAAGIVVAGAQLIPLPIDIWRLLPGRGAALTAMAVAGAHPTALPASLNPGGTARSLVSIAPGVAVFLGVAALDWRLRRPLAWLLLALGAASAILGMAQAAGRLPSFYTITNAGSAVGLFANRNHLAALLYICLPFAMALGAAPNGRTGAISKPAAIVAAAIGGLLLLGVAASGSRAGLALAVLALLGCGALLYHARQGAGRMRAWSLALLAGVVVLLALMQFSRIGTLTQHKVGPIDEDRVIATTTTLGAANSYAPLGSGLGTFVPIFTAVEPVALLSNEYFNHAHDDWAELWLEGGWPMAAVIAGFLTWFTAAAVRAWRPATGSAAVETALSRAGSIAVGLLLLHSAVDYPLRTSAMTAVFGVAAALLIAPTANERGARRHRARHAVEPAVGAI